MTVFLHHLRAMFKNCGTVIETDAIVQFAKRARRVLVAEARMSPSISTVPGDHADADLPKTSSCRCRVEGWRSSDELRLRFENGGRQRGQSCQHVDEMVWMLRVLVAQA